MQTDARSNLDNLRPWLEAQFVRLLDRDRHSLLLTPAATWHNRADASGSWLKGSSAEVMNG